MLESFFLEESIRNLLEDRFQDVELQDCFLVEIHLHKNNKLEVIIDCDNGVTLDKCQRVSRILEAYLDQEGFLGDKYTLEVSSPGLDRPLKLWRQYRKNIGRNVTVTLLSGESKRGTLTAVHEDFIIVDVPVVMKEGKKKRKLTLQTEIPFEQIAKTLINIKI